MTIREVLESEGPILSSEIIKKWSNTNSNIDTIRKKIEREIKKDNINQIKGIWTNNQSFLYLGEQFKSTDFYDKLINALKTDSKSCYSIVHSLALHGGIIKKELLKCYVSSPTELLKGHQKYSTHLELLISNGVVFDNGGEYFELNGLIFPPSLSNFKAIELVRKVTQYHFEDWAKKIGFIAWGNYNKNEEFGKFSWCFKAPSYISGIKKDSSTPGFVLADYLFGKAEYDESDIDFFTSKVDSINMQLGIPKSIIFLIFDTKLSDGAFNKLKARGIVVSSITNLFGEEYSRMIQQILDTIANAFINGDPAQIVTLISKIEKLVDGKTNNLRGDLFELAVALYYTTNSQVVKVSTLINFQGKQREVDVWSDRSNELIITECKAYKGKIKLADIEKWCGEKIPVIFDYYINREQGYAKKVVFEYWSINGFEDDALAFLNEKKAKIKKYSIDFFGREEIIQKANDSGIPKLKDIIKEYFDV